MYISLITALVTLLITYQSQLLLLDDDNEVVERTLSGVGRGGKLRRSRRICFKPTWYQPMLRCEDNAPSSSNGAEETQQSGSPIPLRIHFQKEGETTQIECVTRDNKSV